MAPDVGIYEQHYELKNVDAASDAVDVKLVYEVKDTTPVGSCTNITVNGRITFQLGASYPCGTFVDGQPWIVAPAADAIVARITPDYASGRHGFEVNSATKELPRGQGGCDGPSHPSTVTCDRTQLDDRISDASGVYYFVPPTVTDPLPKTYPPGTSIYKAISYTGPGDCVNGSGGAPARTCVDYAAVLTILGTPPPADAFRPPYSGTEKTLYRSSLVNVPGLPDLPLLSTNQLTLDAARGIFGVNDPMHVSLHGWKAERLSPRFSAINVLGDQYPYGCQMGMANNAAILRVSQTATDAEKREIVLKLVQRGIDLFYSTKNGKDYTGPSYGGCVYPGVISLIKFSGHLLAGQPRADEMLAFMGGDEIANFYWSTTADDGAGGSGAGLWGDDSRACRTVRVGCGNDDVIAPSCDGLRDGGNCRFGPGCPSPCIPTEPQDSLTEIRATGLYTSASYQHMSDVREGSAAVGRIYNWDATPVWDDRGFFSYTDRWGTAPWNYYCTSHCLPYLREMHKQYGCNSPACQAARGE
jgi:hypothetical protein